MKIDLCSSDLRIPVSFGAENSTPDSYGGANTSFTVVLATNAKVVLSSDKEDYKTESRRTTNVYKMWIRYNPDVKTKMNVRWRGKEGVIVGLDNVEESDQWLILKVTENIGE